VRIRSVVADLDQTDVEADPRIHVVQTLPGGASIIETDRYVIFSNIVAELAKRGRHLTEIAGNSRILVSVIAPQIAQLDFKGSQVLFSGPVQARSGWQRVGLDVEVPFLTDVIRQLQPMGAKLELIYDYY
jgi:hypothetical protein